MKRIVISAVNFTEGGPLSILKECLKYLSDDLAGSYEIIALVNDECYFNHKNIKFYSFPNSKKSWANRLYYEYFYFNKFAKQLNPFLWFSLHDITPSVTADRLAVYCHNPAPFYKLSLKDVWLDPKFTLFMFFYKYLYWINIRKNDFVVVQQNWLRQKLVKLFKIENVIVSHPTVSGEHLVEEDWESAKGCNVCVFFYPAFPRVFKNFEIICKASEMLFKQGVSQFEVIFTISGKENKYAEYIYTSYKHIKQIKFIGIQNKNKVCELYRKANCVVFPSKLETWGLPITEAKSLMKPLFLADLEYAHETVGEYDKVKFFDPDDIEQLAHLMKKAINKTVVFDTTKEIVMKGPFARDWKELFDILLNKEIHSDKG